MKHTLNDHSCFLTGDHLYLRPLEPVQDSHLFMRWQNSEEMRRYFNVYPINEISAQERISKLYKDFKNIIFGVARREDHKLVGIVGFKDVNHLNQSAEFYIKIDEREKGNGYGTEATRLMVHYGFMELNLNRIQAQIMEGNIASCRVKEKAGFKREGTIRRAILRGGRYHNVYLYGMLRQEYCEQQVSSVENCVEVGVGVLAW